MNDLSRQENRLELINNINSENNKARKQVSFKSSEIQGGRIEQYVLEKLLGQFNPDSVREMPIVSTINVQKSIVKAKSSIYKKSPERLFEGLNENQELAIKRIYDDMKLDQKLNTMNKNYNYQDQSIGMIVPKNGKLICRILKMHQVDVIPSMDDPETAQAYVISAFDRTDYEFRDNQYADKQTATGYVGRSVRSTANPDNDLEIAEKYQYQKYVEKYIIWTNEFNFMMNGLGEVISDQEDISNPIGFMPFFEVSCEKDFEYFVRSSNTLSNFTVEFNSFLSDLQNAAKMSAYAVAILKAPAEMQPDMQVIGASMLLKLNTDDPDKEVDFSFASPSASISEISDSIDRLLNYFITSEGLNKNVVNSSGDADKAMSGIDRFLMMLQKVEAHADDYKMFEDVEVDIYRIIMAWIQALNTTDQLNDKYKMVVPSELEMAVNYHMPQMIQTDSEKIDIVEKKIEAGLISRIDAMKQIHNIDDVEKIEQMIKDIDNERQIL
jgi:hypothetical protein